MAITKKALALIACLAILATMTSCTSNSVSNVPQSIDTGTMLATDDSYKASDEAAWNLEISTVTLV